MQSQRVRGGGGRAHVYVVAGVQREDSSQNVHIGRFFESDSAAAATSLFVHLFVPHSEASPTPIPP